jgi:hypothetical protein
MRSVVIQRDVESTGTMGLLSGSHCPIGEYGETVARKKSAESHAELEAITPLLTSFPPIRTSNIRAFPTAL